VSEKNTDRRLQDLVAGSFQKHFGPTPIEERVADIQRQTSKLSRYVDTPSLREAAGDLLSAVLQLANEHDWDVHELIDETLERIDRRHETYKKFGRRLRVGILGGAFDPIHLGHVEISRIALESGHVDEVWWMPCYSHLAGKRMASPEHRLAMCHAASEGIDAIRVFDFEIRHRYLGEMYHLAKRLVADEEIESRYVLHYLIGRDNVESMHAWANFESLRRMMPVLVIASHDLPNPPPDAWYRHKPHQYIDRRTSFDSSSTAIRRGIASGDPKVEKLLPAKVLQYIRENDLYKSDRGPLKLSKDKTRRVAAMIGSFDPPTTAQVELVERMLSAGYDSVKIFPSAHVRGGLIIEHAEPVHRAALIDLTFGGRPRVEVDFRGLEDERAVAPATLTRTFEQDDMWFVINEDAVAERNFSPDQTGQRSIVRRADVVISDLLGVADATAFSLQNVDTTTDVTVTLGGVVQTGGKTIVTLDFSGGSVDAVNGLLDGNYRLQIDGDALGVTGGAQSEDFHRLFGDSDGDRDVDGSDLSNLVGGLYFGATQFNAVFDLNDNDSLFDEIDDFFANFGRSL